MATVPVAHEQNLGMQQTQQKWGGTFYFGQLTGDDVGLNGFEAVNACLIFLNRQGRILCYSKKQNTDETTSTWHILSLF
jgi:hypothetical protein